MIFFLTGKVCPFSQEITAHMTGMASNLFRNGLGISSDVTLISAVQLQKS